MSENLHVSMMGCDTRSASSWMWLEWEADYESLSTWLVCSRSVNSPYGCGKRELLSFHMLPFVTTKKKQQHQKNPGLPQPQWIVTSSGIYCVTDCVAGLWQSMCDLKAWPLSSSCWSEKWTISLEATLTQSSATMKVKDGKSCTGLWLFDFYVMFMSI